MRSVLHGLSTVLMVTGALLLLDAVLTLVWQEPVTAIYTKVRQQQLSSDLAALESEAPSALEVAALSHLNTDSQRIAFLARAEERTAREGSGIGRIRIPHIHADFVIVKGTTLGDLESGPGIYPQTRFPGVPGTTAIAGHRTTYLAPFRHIDALRPGDVIDVDMPYAHFTYLVSGRRIVAPTDVGVIDPVGYSRLVLSACTPLYSAAQRIIVFARLIRTVPVGAAARA